MKWLRTIVLFSKDNVIEDNDWKTLHESYLRSIASIDFPQNSGSLKLRRKQRQQNGQWKRNGVKYLKDRFLNDMTEVEKWTPEGVVGLKALQRKLPLQLYPSCAPYQEPITSRFGGFDFHMKGDGGNVAAIEWETGNISSSHRSMNKLGISLQAGLIDIGVLIVPSRELYSHLTDRIGNISELSGYLELWAGLGASVKRGLLAITVVEHDELTDNEQFDYLPVGIDGRARQ